MPILKINNANFYYELHGSGQPIIFISGYACDHTAWIPLLEAFAKKFQILIFDNRAVGQTKDDNNTLTANKMAQDVIDLAAQLELKNPHIIGHSMGGAIAQSVASLFPEKIGKLCLLNAAAKWRKAVEMAFKSLLDMREKNIDINIQIETVLPWLFGEKFLENEINCVGFKEGILKNPHPQSFNDQARHFKMLEQFDGTTNLKKIQASTLVVCGSQDIITLPQEAEFVASNIPNAKLLKLDCGHSVMYEVPEQLVRVLMEFL